MIFIDSLDARRNRFTSVVQTNVHLFRFDRMTRRRVIREQHSHARLFLNHGTIDSFVQAVNKRIPIAKLMQQLKRAIRRFRNAVQVEQSEAAMKRH